MTAQAGQRRIVQAGDPAKGERNYEKGGCRRELDLPVGAQPGRSRILYLIAQSSISSLGGSDAAGNSMSAGFAMIAEFLLWGTLVVFLLLCCVPARLPDLVVGLGAGLVGLAAIASLTAVGMMDRPSWIRIAPTLLPPLVVLFGIYSRYSVDQPQRTRRLVSLGFGALTVLLSVPPFIEYQRWVDAAPEREAEAQRAEADYRRREAEARTAYQSEFRALGPGSRVDDFLPFLASEFEEEAVIGIAGVRSRQADIIRLMSGETKFYELERLSEFELRVTPELCGAYRAALDRRLAQFVPTNPNYRGVPGELEGQPANMRWLMRNGCDLSPQVSRLAVAVRSLLPDHYFPSYAQELEAIAGRE